MPSRRARHGEVLLKTSETETSEKIGGNFDSWGGINEVILEKRQVDQEDDFDVEPNESFDLGGYTEYTCWSQ